MYNGSGRVDYFNSCKSAGKFNQFIWSLSGSVLHVYQGEEEVPADSYVYQEIRDALSLRMTS